MSTPSEDFRRAYAGHRAREGRALDAETLCKLPYLNVGPLARQWRVRARTFEAFKRRIVLPLARAKNGPLDIADLGAGNGWLSHRMALCGHRAVAVDIREDAIDGLGAAATLAAGSGFICLNSSFVCLPFADDTFDIVLFNASLHYASDLTEVLHEAARVTRSGGTVAILDSPFYRREADGAAMVAEKRCDGRNRFGDEAGILLSQDFVEFLTPAGLRRATPRLSWRRYRVLYPLWYELRTFEAFLRRKRVPSRFDFWTAVVR